MKTATPAQIERAKEKRAEFMALIKELTAIEKAVNPDFQSKGSINPMLISYYQAETGQTDFRTFKGWRDAGYMVKKGEHGYQIFSRPISAIKEEKGQQPETGDHKHFGTCYLFHAGQVEKITKD